jgi:hypothetical protein
MDFFFAAASITIGNGKNLGIPLGSMEKSPITSPLSSMRSPQEINGRFIKPCSTTHGSQR